MAKPAASFDIDAALDAGIALANARKTWGGHDRITTVGASEIGGCIRRVWYGKRGVDTDVHYVQDIGPLERGMAIEDWVVLRVQDAIRNSKAFADWELIWSGAEQQTLVDGDQSATSDGLLVHRKAKAPPIYLEIKSQDPRIYETQTTAQVGHKLQTTQGMDLVRRKSPYRPERAILIYINASFVSQRRWHWIDFVQASADALKRRATDIMRNKRYSVDHPPAAEGIHEGGKECDYCPFRERCFLREIGRLPDNVKHVEKPVQDQLRELLLQRATFRIQENDAETARKTIENEVIEILVQHDTKRVVAPWGSVSVFKANSPPHVDWDKLESKIGKDGIVEVRKAGTPYKRISVSMK